ncbi:tripartite tricarboxylate transporter permease [Pontitalea aquivivens]|uniref:tripartite tricarboxylate transporter permease n=1 Tax=Pontitalea aquivivens TaxID=3388663 RepID=UPI0039711402
MEQLSSIASSALLGLDTAMTWANLWYCFVGCLLGMVVGVIPGIGALAAISLLFPYTFYMEPTSALIMLAGIFYGTAYGGSIASILLNLPGTPSSAVVCLDGYPMSQQGRAGVALLMTAVASFTAASISIVLMMISSPVIADFAIKFRSPEFFALMVLGLVAASTITDGSPLKGLAMVVFGILLGVVGMDMYTGEARMTFGSLHLQDGIGLVPLAMGLFGVAEVIATARYSSRREVLSVSLRSMVPSRDDFRRSWKPILRGTGIGAFFGVLPGAGPTAASFMSYALEKNMADEPGRFGKGAIEGICGPEAANNAADQTAFIPTLTLGIPGSATMALLLGVLIIHGITPGPAMLDRHPEMFWGLVMSFWTGNLILLILSVPLIGLWVSLLRIPYNYMYPAIVMFVCLGVYSVNNSIFEIWLVLSIGALGYLLRVLGFPVTPLLLGFVLGPMMEEHFRRAMIISRGDATVFFTRPTSGTIMAITILLLLWVVWSTYRRKRQRRHP